MTYSSWSARGSDLGDGGLEVLDRSCRLDPQVDRGRADDGGGGGERRGLEADAVGGRYRRPVPVGIGRPGVPAGRQAGQWPTCGSSVKVALDAGPGCRRGERAARSEVASVVDRAGRRPAGEVGRVGRLDGSRPGGTGAVVEQRRGPAVSGRRTLPGRWPRSWPPVNRMAGNGAWLDTPEAKPVNSSRMALARALGWVGTLSAHVDVEELEPAADGLRIGRVDVVAVDHVGEQRGRLGDGVDERRPLRSGLLVL